MRFLVDLIQRKLAARKQVRLSSTKNFYPDCHIRMESHARLGNVTIDQTHSSESLLVVGAYSYVRSDSRLLSISAIGRFCSIGRNVTLGLNPRNHPLHWVSSSTQFSRQYNRKVTPLKIGNDVWIGDNAVLMAGIEVGDGAVIGCDAVVTKNVLPYQIVAGNPARPIRRRFEHKVIHELLKIQWWQFDISELNKIDFENVDNFCSEVKTLRRKAEYACVEIHGRRIKIRS